MCQLISPPPFVLLPRVPGTLRGRLRIHTPPPANNINFLGMQKDSPLAQLLQRLSPMDPEARGHALEQDTVLAHIHEDTSRQGQTLAPDAETDVDLHFICLLPVAGAGGTEAPEIVELDGRRPQPVSHGPVAAGTSFLHAVAPVIQGFMDREPGNGNFSILALVPAVE